MPRWGEKVLRNAPKDIFLFTQVQAERLRAAVLARVWAAEAQPLPEIAAVQ